MPVISITDELPARVNRVPLIVSLPPTVSKPVPVVIAWLLVVLKLKEPVPEWSITGLAPVRLTKVEARVVVAPETVRLLFTVVVPDPAPILTEVPEPARFTVVATVFTKLKDD